MLMPYLCQQQICPSNATYMSHCQLVHVQIWDIYVSIYTQYELTAMNNGPEALVYIHRYYWIYPWTNIPVTLLLYVPQDCCCNLHISPYKDDAERQWRHSSTALAELAIAQPNQPKHFDIHVFLCVKCLPKPENMVYIMVSIRKNKGNNTLESLRI